MKTKFIKPSIILLFALAFFVCGLLLIISPHRMSGLALTIARVIAVGFGLFAIIKSIFVRKNDKSLNIILIVLYVVFMILLFVVPSFFSASIPRIAGVWIIFNGTVYSISGVLFFKNRSKGGISSLLKAAISFVFGIILIANPSENLFSLMQFFGVYLGLYGLSLFGDFLRELLQLDVSGKYIKRKIHIALPVFLVAFIPQQLLNSVNELLKTDPQQITLLENVTADEKSNTGRVLEIFIHMSPQTAMGFGHVDFALNDVCYTYGSYDSATWKLQGFFSEGVLVRLQKKDYIPFSIQYEKKLLVGYKVFLSEENYDALQKTIDTLMQDVTPWHCALSLDPGGTYEDPASILYDKTKADFYKFTKSQHYKGFKTYFALKTNCVYLVDTVLGRSGIDILGINGIITPGTYYSRLDYLYQQRNSFVYEKNIYKISQ